MNRIVHFEFATPDPPAEAEFFKTVFGWQTEKWGEEEYWLATTGKDEIGIDGAFMPLSGAEQQRVVNVIEVEDLEASLASSIDAGATVVMERQEIPEIGWTAYVATPTGIVIGMIEAMPMTAEEAPS